MRMHAIGSLLTAILALLLGAIVIRKGKRSAEKWTFAWFCLSIFFWFASYSIMESTRDPSKALFFARVGHSSVIIVPIAYLHFVRYFLKRPLLKPFYLAYYGIGMILLWRMWATDAFIPGVVLQSWGYYPQGSPLMLFDAMLVVITAVSCWILFYIDCRTARSDSDKHEYNRLKWCCLAMTIFSFSGLDYLPKFGINIYPFGFLTAAIFVSIMAYAILVHRFMDIRVVFRKSITYSVLAATITTSYMVAVLIMEKWFQGFFGYRSIVATSIVGFGTALGFTPLKNWVQQFVDRYFFKKSTEELVEENERLRKQVERTERLKAVATLAAGMAHEIKNPLASIKTFAEYLPQKYDDPVFREKFAKIMGQEVDKMSDLVQRLLEFAKPSPPQLELVKMSQVIKDTLSFIQGTLLKKQITVDTAFVEQDEVTADAAQLRQVMLNILLNGVEAMEQSGRIAISTARENGHLSIAVADTGRGIPAKELPHIFDPFYTTKSSGTGLGLSVVHSIIRQHGGRINVQSKPGQGTRVEIELPVKGGANGAHAHSDCR